jgi:hypothetical protein
MTIKLLEKLNHFPVPPMCCIPWIDGPGDIHTVALPCPNCGRPFCLANHEIENGIVKPSVVCPFDCGFHDFLRIV